MAIGARHATSRSSKQALGPAEIPGSRLIFLLILAIPMAAFWLLTSRPSADSDPASPPSSGSGLATLLANPRAFLGEDRSQAFLPTPVAMLPPEANAGPPALAAREEAEARQEERGKVANTGGVGAVLRAEPPAGRQVSALRDGQAVEILERLSVNGAEWLRVRTTTNVEGWVFGRLVVPAQ